MEILDAGLCVCNIGTPFSVTVPERPIIHRLSEFGGRLSMPDVVPFLFKHISQRKLHPIRTTGWPNIAVIVNRDPTEWQFAEKLLHCHTEIQTYQFGLSTVFEILATKVVQIYRIENIVVT